MTTILDLNPRYFKLKKRKTYFQFLVKIRIGHACRLLLDNELSVSEICYSCGYNTIITKPFNLPFVEHTINSLLSNRQRSKDHYSAEVFPETRSMASKKTEHKFIADFSSVVERNISNASFNVEQICAEMKISRVQLYRKVKALMDCNVNEYIGIIRLQKAKYYLQYEDLSIAE